MSKTFRRKIILILFTESNLISLHSDIFVPNQSCNNIKALRNERLSSKKKYCKNNFFVFLCIIVPLSSWYCCSICHILFILLYSFLFIGKFATRSDLLQLQPEQHSQLQRRNRTSSLPPPPLSTTSATTATTTKSSTAKNFLQRPLLPEDQQLRFNEEEEDSKKQRWSWLQAGATK